MKIINRMLICLVTCYQVCVSPLIQGRCRFYPTCSSYAKEALARYNVLTALWLIIRRLSKCHPFHPGDIDEIKK